jgi:hypothetical protein
MRRRAADLQVGTLVVGILVVAPVYLGILTTRH